jgi:transcriptional regulator with GAF, ATPase, and Fis domain
MFFQIRRAFFFICGSLVGVSPSMKALRRALWTNVFTRDMQLYSQRLWSRMEDFSTMMLGETGTGKGAAAAAIGRSGFIPYNAATGRFETSFMESFVSINLSQFPESLIESELFGHRKGAFTGAIEPHKGIFARCSSFGAIFLDEIGDVSVPVQIKLLRVLQERVFSPVGCHTQEQFRGRVIAASNRSIEALRRTGRFRDDFYYRLCSDIIEVPTLRQRIRECPEELDLLLGIVTNRILGISGPANRCDHTPPDIAMRVRKILDRDVGPDYGWPGNVRELEQSVRRILLCGAYRGERELARESAGSPLIDRISRGLCSADELLAGYCRLLYDQHGTVQEVARRLQLDRRTVTRHIRNDRTGQHPPCEPSPPRE